MGLREKSLMNIPARFAIAMTDELGFINRNQIIWHKPACMPSSAKDRFTVDFESIFFFTKSGKYYFEQQLEPSTNAGKVVSLGEKSFSRGQALGAGLEPSGNGKADTYTVKENRNMRTVWSVNFEPSKRKHFASYPTRLIETPIKAGCPQNGIVYDPFTGTGTTQVVAERLGRRWVGSELLPDYYEIALERLGLSERRMAA
jgi:site-specific DNA-methyltransferase (adenine-specific)